MLYAIVGANSYSCLLLSPLAVFSCYLLLLSLSVCHLCYGCQVLAVALCSYLMLDFFNCCSLSCPNLPHQTNDMSQYILFQQETHSSYWCQRIVWHTISGIIRMFRSWYQPLVDNCVLRCTFPQLRPCQVYILKWDVKCDKSIQLSVFFYITYWVT